MSSLERFRRSNGRRARPPAPAPAPSRSGGGPAVHRSGRGPGSLAGAEDVGFVGRPVEYQLSAFSLEESWQLLSPGMREWARSRAGAAIRDPHTGVPTVYAYCRVAPDEQAPPGGPTPASYELVLFGKRGLVVSDGTTQDLVAQPGATKWRHHRFDLPIDPTAIRNDHRRGAPGNSATAGAAGVSGGGGGGPHGLESAPAPALPLDVTVGSGSGPLPSEVAEMFGNLPLPTQRFLLGPFTSTGRPPVQARVYPGVLEQGGHCREHYWTCLFNGGWLAFAAAERSVPRRHDDRGPAPWQASVDDLRRAPWTVAAWAAPIDKSVGPIGPTAPPDPFGAPGPFGGP